MSEDFTSAGIAIDLADDLLLARWQKLVWNIPFNGLYRQLKFFAGARSEVHPIFAKILGDEKESVGEERKT